MTNVEALGAKVAELELLVRKLVSGDQLGASTFGGTDEDDVEAVPVNVGDALADANDASTAIPRLQDDIDEHGQAVSALAGTIDAAMDELDARLELGDTNLVVAREEIEEAQGLVDEAFGQRVDGLSEDVTVAVTAAGNALTESQAATAAAQAAAGLADSKGEVIVQVSAPTGSRANPANLWINITPDANGNPRNTPNRYNATTSAWEPITDQKAIDAAAAAASAVSQAAAAKTAADAAQATASDAKTTANDASTAALAAAGLANSKGKVIYQSTKPTGANAVVGNLWIRTSDSKPFVFDPTVGTSGDWVQVTDQTAIDAAAAAAAAKTAADNAAAAAAAAQVTADGRPLILFSAATPSGTAPTGSTWFMVNTAQAIVGQWQQTGTAASPVWTARPIASEVIANLDVGKLTAGNAAIATLVAQKIAASTASFQTVNVSNLFVTEGATMDTATINFLFAKVVQAKKITVDMLDVATLNGISLTGVTIDAGTFTSVSSNADGSSTTTTMLRGGQLQFQNRVNGSLTGQSSVYTTGGTLQFSNPDGYMMLGAGNLRLGSRGLSAGLTSFKIGPGGSESFTIDGDSGDTASTGKGTFGGIVQSRAFRAPVTNDASLTSTGHGFQVGTDDGANLIADNNEIMARNNGAAASLFINADGGNVGIGGAGSTVTVTGKFVAPGDTDWINLNVTGGTPDTAFPPQYRRVGGWVSLRGNIAPTSTLQTVGNLPAGFRPGVAIEASCVRGTGTTATPVFWDVRLQAGGNLALMGPTGGSSSINLGGFPAFLADN